MYFIITSSSQPISLFLSFTLIISIFIVVVGFIISISLDQAMNDLDANDRSIIVTRTEASSQTEPQNAVDKAESITQKHTETKNAYVQTNVSTVSTQSTQTTTPVTNDDIPSTNTNDTIIIHDSNYFSPNKKNE